MCGTLSFSRVLHNKVPHTTIQLMHCDKKKTKKLNITECFYKVQYRMHFFLIKFFFFLMVFPYISILGQVGNLCGYLVPDFLGEVGGAVEGEAAHQRGGEHTAPT